MSVGVWKPGGDAKSRVVDSALLSRFSELANGLAGVVDAGMLDIAGLANENWWEAGNKSPVIPLVKILKERGDFEADLRKWIKSNTKNRYLPNGSAL